MNFHYWQDTLIECINRCGFRGVSIRSIQELSDGLFFQCMLAFIGYKKIHCAILSDEVSSFEIYEALMMFLKDEYPTYFEEADIISLQDDTEVTYVTSLLFIHCCLTNYLHSFRSIYQEVSEEGKRRIVYFLKCVLPVHSCITRTIMRNAIQSIGDSIIASANLKGLHVSLPCFKLKVYSALRRSSLMHFIEKDKKLKTLALRFGTMKSSFQMKNSETDLQESNVKTQLRILNEPCEILGKHLFQAVLGLQLRAKEEENLILQEQVQYLKLKNQIMSDNVGGLQSRLERSLADNEIIKIYNKELETKVNEMDNLQEELHKAYKRFCVVDAKLRSLTEQKISLNNELVGLRTLLSSKETEMNTIKDQMRLIEGINIALHNDLQNARHQLQEKLSSKDNFLETCTVTQLKKDEILTLTHSLNSAISTLVKEGESIRKSVEAVRCELSSLNRTKENLHHHAMKECGTEASASMVSRHFSLSSSKTDKEENAKIDSSHSAQSILSTDCDSDILKIYENTKTDSENLNITSDTSSSEDSHYITSQSLPTILQLHTELEDLRTLVTSQQETISSLNLLLQTSQFEKCELQRKLNEMAALNKNLSNEKNHAIIRKNMLKETIKEMQIILHKKTVDHRMKTSAKEVMRIKAAYKVLNEENRTLQHKYSDLKKHLDNVIEKYENKLERLKSQMASLFNDETANSRKSCVRRSHLKEVCNLCTGKVPFLSRPWDKTY